VEEDMVMMVRFVAGALGEVMGLAPGTQQDAQRPGRLGDLPAKNPLPPAKNAINVRNGYFSSGLFYVVTPTKSDFIEGTS
jgi:hypothetical protein